MRSLCERFSFNNSLSRSANDVPSPSWTEQTSATIRDFTLGGYVTNSIGGIRSFPYSTSATTNPLRYSTVKTLNEVHG